MIIITMACWAGKANGKATAAWNGPMGEKLFILGELTSQRHHHSHRDHRQCHCHRKCTSEFLRGGNMHLLREPEPCILEDKQLHSTTLATIAIIIFAIIKYG